MRRIVCDLSRHIPIRAQASHHVIPGTNHIVGQTADPIVTHTDIVHVRVRDARPVAANTACVATCIRVLETGRRSKIQTCVSTRFAESMTREEG